MGKVTYIEHNGTEHVVDVPNGPTLMQAAVSRMVPGIEGDCGGGCACATCHIYLNEEWRSRCEPPDDLEIAVMDFAYDVGDDSRLSCQIKMSDELDGIIVRIAERQY